VQSSHQNFLFSLTSEASKIHQSFALQIESALTRRKFLVHTEEISKEMEAYEFSVPVPPGPRQRDRPFGETACCRVYEAVERVLHSGKMQCCEGL